MKILESRLPKHIAFIMDGNGRWAQRRALPRKLGHKAGVEAIKKTIDACIKFGVKYCSFFAFSTENWKRSKDEIDGIFALVRDYLNNNSDYFIERQVKIESIGVLTPFPEDLKLSLETLKQKTKHFDRTTVIFALNYGGRDDIARACEKLVAKGHQQITEDKISENLDSARFPDPDFVIRTSGEQRLSNFMLFQMAYSELYFPKVYWPDFNEKQLKKAILKYQKRDRRYGGLK